jgi:NADH-quinone oxidoreductase subunit I
LAPLLPGMEQPPHALRLGGSEREYFAGLPDSGQDTRVPGRAAVGGAA